MKQKLSYQGALDTIYSFIDHSLTRNLRYAPEKFNLSRMHKLLDLLHNPQNDYKIIHVAGTKGKGSICAMLTSILTRAGFRTGFYSSPHLIDFTERIRIGDVFIPHEKLAAYIGDLKSTIDRVEEITAFEITTALAFKYFADQKVDFAVIEVGLGGRFDATNVVTPEISVISTISFDHTKILGNTLSKIAFEKAGIIKEGVPVVVSRQKKTAKEMIIKIAQQRNAKFIDAHAAFPVCLIFKCLDGQIFEIENGSSTAGPFQLPLLGEHQLENAATAYAVLSLLADQDIPIPEEVVYEGFKSVSWPGRFEILKRDPLVIIDGAHNPDSFRKLAATIEDYLPGKQITLVFGVSEDKNVHKMLEIMKPKIHQLIITQSTHPRALPAAEIHSMAKSMGIPSMAIADVIRAAREAEKQAAPNEAIVAAGSIFIAAALREIYLPNG